MRKEAKKTRQPRVEEQADKHKSESCRISRLEVTGDTLTGRGGLAFFVKYVKAAGIPGLLVGPFSGIRKSAKGVKIENLFLQALYFFFDGTSRHLVYFDELAKDEGYTGVIETPRQQMASSHAMKRFFGAFGCFAAKSFRGVLKELFVWRLKLAAPRIVMLTLDTMVMDNDEAAGREGCDSTYKKVKGFQPLQLIWEGKIVDAVFRRGKRHSNYGTDVPKMIRETVTLIRSRYAAGVEIVIRFDSGFFDEENFALCDKLGIGFIGTGKVYDAVKKKVAALSEEEWKGYDNGRQSWSYARFEYRCDKWKRGYRALYTRPRYEDRQKVLDFARPDNIILTNLNAGEPALETMAAGNRTYWLKDETVIYHHHQRGADELPHRGLKDFGSETLPFKRFAANQAWYYLMLIGFFLFETFKEDTLKEILPVTSYPTTVRRKLVDFAAKIVRKGGQWVLKTTAAVMERLNLATLWERCHNAPPILQT